jgi:hypothetical protein
MLSRRLLVLFFAVLSIYGLSLIFSIYGAFSWQNNDFQTSNRWKNVAVAIKTGKQVAADRIPILTETFLKNAPSIIFIGDKDMKVGNTKVVGVLENLYEDNDLSVGSRPKNLVDEKQGWREDAHKNLPGFKLLYDQFPDKSWYVMIDDDTYILMDALQQKLKHFNPNEPYFFGNYMHFSGCDDALSNELYFGHGGSGVVLPKAAMKMLISSMSSCIPKYRKCWAGDVRVALCLRDLNIFIERDDNTLGEFNNDIPGPNMVWGMNPCLHPITFHKLLPRHMQSLHKIETELHQKQKIPTLADVISRFDSITETIEIDKSWLDEDTLETLKSKTPEECKNLCKRFPRCSAWMLDEAKTCTLKGSFSRLLEFSKRYAGIVPSHVVCRST